MPEQTRGQGEWIGVDFDGVLAKDAVALGVFPDVGPPIPAMIARVRAWLTEGKDVRVFTARVNPGTVGDCARFGRTPLEWYHYQVGLIENFCLAQFGAPLPITCVKDYKMIALWDDRCVQMVTDTGEPAVARPTGEPSCHACGGPIQIGEPVTIYHAACDAT